MVVSRVSGSWKKALSVVLPGNASAFAGAKFDEIACANNGDCMATGTFNTITGAVQPLVALSHSFAWSRAVEVNVPGAAANPETTVFGFQGSSCAASGDCAFGGQFRDKSGHFQGFLENVVNGDVQRAQVLALPAGAQQAGRNGGVVSVSCPAIGACVAGATYLNAKQQYEPLVAHETKNVWTLGTTVVLPGGASTVGVDGGVYSVRCFSSTSCAVSGSYVSASRYEGFALTLRP
jgi:hypothetical protein